MAGLVVKVCTLETRVWMSNLIGCV